MPRTIFSATITMGKDAFTQAAADLRIHNGAAVVNASQQESRNMIAKACS